MEQQKPDPEDDLWSTAWAIRFGEQRFQVIKKDMFEDGLRKGEKKGRVEGMEFVLHQLIHSKYHIDAHDWIETLTEEDYHRVSSLLFACDTFEQLTQEMNHTE